MHAVVVSLQMMSRSLTDKYTRLRPDNPAGRSQGLVSPKTSAQIQSEQSVSPCLRQATECLCRHSSFLPLPTAEEEKLLSLKNAASVRLLLQRTQYQHILHPVYLKRHEHSNMFTENTRRHGGLGYQLPPNACKKPQVLLQLEKYENSSCL